MKIVLIYFSHMGHTKQVIDKAVEELKNHGHQVTRVALETVEPLNLSSETADIKSVPPISEYQGIILGTPVHGGRMSAPMRGFLDSVPSLSGKSAAVIITHFFREGWGAVQTIRELRKFITEKGGNYLGAVNVKWLSLSRKRSIQSAVRDLIKFYDETE